MHATFAYCRLGSSYQKYTTLYYYSPEARGILDALNAPEFKCNHPRGTHSAQAGGRSADGKFSSAAAAAYPVKLCWVLTRALTLARTGSPEPVSTSAQPFLDRAAERPSVRE